VKDFKYQEAKAELDELMAWFESSDATVDEAIDKYQQAEVLIKQLERYLTDTKTKIKQITKQVDTK